MDEQQHEEKLDGEMEEDGRWKNTLACEMDTPILVPICCIAEAAEAKRAWAYTIGGLQRQGLRKN